MFTLLTHASLPSSFWVEALHTASYLHNILPTKLLQNNTPISIIYHRQPSYDHLRVFRCLCYPNTSSTRPHKLSPRSTPCVFLGYPANYRGYRCLDLSTSKTIFSRHVTFDEQHFPYKTPNSPPPSHAFLDPSPLLFDHFSPPPNPLDPTPHPSHAANTPLPTSSFAPPDPPNLSDQTITAPTTIPPPPIPTSSHPCKLTLNRKFSNPANLSRYTPKPPSPSLLFRNLIHRPFRSKLEHCHAQRI